MSKKIAIVQSNYIPWKGYFDMINMVDEFILYDDAQYTTDDWRNRNRIKTDNGLLWLTIPIRRSGRSTQAIREAVTPSHNWYKKHWRSIKFNYARCAHFDDYKEWLEALYMAATMPNLSTINHLFISAICEVLGIKTPLTWSMDYDFDDDDDPTAKVVAICQRAGAERYLSGPAAKDYMNLTLFEEAGITVEWMDYSGYPEYEQLHPPFEHSVTVLDLILNTGPEAHQYMKSFS